LVRLDRRQLIVLGVLAVAVALYAAATAAGARQGSGASPASGGGLPETLGRVLVQPASDRDVAAAAPGCQQGGALAVPAGQECLYRLRSGFLGKRLRLRLAGGDSLTAVLVQPKPKVTDTETLDAGHAMVDLVYRQDGSTLRLLCGSTSGPTCQVRLGG
jgi:hypothetical protein